MRCWWLCVFVACNGTDDTQGDPDHIPDDGDADADADTDADADADSDTDVEPSTAETGDTETEPRTDLIGRTYALDVAGANWVEPANVGSLFASLLGDLEVLAMPVDVDVAHIDWLFAPSASAVQAQCVPSVAAPTT